MSSALTLTHSLLCRWRVLSPTGNFLSTSGSPTRLRSLDAFHQPKIHRRRLVFFGCHGKVTKETPQGTHGPLTSCCGARKNRRAYADPRFFRPRPLAHLASSATGGARLAPLLRGFGYEKSGPYSHANWPLPLSAAKCGIVYASPPLSRLLLQNVGAFAPLAFP